jgi:hypothetical protein
MQINGKTIYLVLIFIVGWSLFVACRADRDTPSAFDSPVQSPETFDSPMSPLVTPTTVLAPTADPTSGLSQEQPAPLGVTVIAEDGLRITVLEVHRDAAVELINMNPFNTPLSSEEVIIIRVRVSLPESPSSPFTLLPFDFDMLDDGGTIHPYPLTVMVQGELAGQFTRAATMEGLLAFRIPRGHTNPFLRYYPKNRGEFYESRWLALQ